MTKIDIFSGFLGAGKTTLIKKLLQEALDASKVVLIENEFGEIGIDGGFLKDAGIEITEMNSGCICCTLVGDFSKALQKVLEEYKPDRVLIEPSGVGKLSDIVKAIEDVKKDAEIEIGGRITVVDGKKANLYLKNFGEFFEDQVKHASTIVISRTQMMTNEKVEECVRMLREENGDASIISTPWEELGRESLCRALEHGGEIEGLLESHCSHHHEECEHGHHHECGECEHEHHHEHHHEHGEHCCGHDHHGHHHHADEVFTSWGVETAYKFSEDELKDIINKLSTGSTYGEVLRAKGIVASTDGEWFHFDLVPEETELRRGAADFTGRICVIGSKLDEEAIKELFHVA